MKKRAAASKMVHALYRICTCWEGCNSGKLLKEMVGGTRLERVTFCL